MSVDDYNPFDDLTPDLYRIMPKDSPIFGKTTNTQTATEVKDKSATFEQVQRDFAKKLDAELFNLMTQGTLSVVDYTKLFSSIHICVDCGTLYSFQTYNMTRDLPTTHCPSCEDAQKEAAGLK